MVNHRLKFSLLLVFFALFPFEIIAWLLNFMNCRDPAQLLHPQLLPDLALASIFYSFSALGWYVLHNYRYYTARHVFILQGILGLIVEQGGAVVVTIFSNPLAIFLWLFVLCFYGAPAALAYYFTGGLDPTLKGTTKTSFFVSLVVLVFATIIGGLLISQLSIGISRYPICSRPLL